MDLNNIFSGIPKDLENEAFDLLVQSNALTIERIVSKGHTSPESGWYDQKRNEWVLVLKGKATLSFENQESIDLSEGDFINIPPHKKHKVTWTDPENETIWLAIHY